MGNNIRMLDVDEDVDGKDDTTLRGLVLFGKLVESTDSCCSWHQEHCYSHACTSTYWRSGCWSFCTLSTRGSCHVDKPLEP
jgi:hypothetical protein